MYVHECERGGAVMAEGKELYLTQEGLDEIKKELDELKLVKRPEVISALKDARAQGDLSENAEYDAARTYWEGLRFDRYCCNKKKNFRISVYRETR